MIFNLALFLIGFYILIKGASILIRGASALAGLLQISPWVIGMVIVGIGTSIPEFAVGFISAFNHAKVDIGLGTIIGSNTMNILFILGLSAILRPLVLKKEWVAEDLVFNIFSVLLAAALLPFGLSRPEAVILFGVFLFWLIRTVSKKRQVNHERKADIVAFPLAFFLIAAGLLGIILGGKWVVDGAAAIAKTLGASEALIGLTVVGIGTSLPELAATAVAAWRGNFGIAVGNIIGSNIFDFLGILGFTGIFRPIPFDPKFTPDIIITAVSAALLFLAMFLGERYVLKRWQGAVFILVYFLYIIFIIQRG